MAKVSITSTSPKSLLNRTGLSKDNQALYQLLNSLITSAIQTEEVLSVASVTPIIPVIPVSLISQQFILGQNGQDGDDGISFPGLPGSAGATGATGPAGNSGIGIPGTDGEDGENALRAFNTPSTVSTSGPGLAPILSGNASQFLNGLGAYAVPAGGTSSSAVPIVVTSNLTIATQTGMVIPESLEVSAGVILEIVNGARVEVTGAAPKPALTFIAEYLLTGDAPSVTFASIPGTFRHLRLVFYGRTTDPGENNDIFLQFNGDVAANYDYQRNGFAKVATSFSGNFGQVKTSIGVVPGAGSSATTQSGMTEVIIPLYAGTSFQKSGTAYSGQVSFTSSSGSTESVLVGFLWRSTAAITSITLLPTTLAFKTGSIFSLYGMQ